MTYLSVCSGIESVSVAWEPLGWQAIGFAEIEPFPRELLKQRFPHVKNYGDITQYEKWDIGQFDVLVGGTPCQSFSIAGKRGGTNDIRGRLMYSYLGIVAQYKPTWILWENVPGVLSSGNGTDFASFLAGLEQCGYGWCYRVLDAQYFGVPQRRRRVFVVGSFGNYNCTKVLFESEGTQGGIAESRETEKNTTERTDGSLPVMFRNLNNNSVYKKEERTANTIISRYGTGGNNTPLILDSSTSKKLRRMTPIECERLQGFPDDWAKISWRGKSVEQCPDSLRYKAIGNSMAVPVIRWIGKRIQREEIKK